MPNHDWLASDQSQCITVVINTVSRSSVGRQKRCGKISEKLRWCWFKTQEMGGGMLGMDELVLLPDVK